MYIRQRKITRLSTSNDVRSCYSFAPQSVNLSPEDSLDYFCLFSLYYPRTDKIVLIMFDNLEISLNICIKTD